MSRSGVACATCVAIAIAKGHVRCVRHLLSERRLQSEWLWLPALHVTQISRAGGYADREVLKVLREWRCLHCSAASASTASSCNSEQQNSQRESVKNCDHIQSFMSAEEERKCVQQPRQSAFFAFSLNQLALSSAEPEIRTFFLHNSKMNLQTAVWDHSALFRSSSIEHFLKSGPFTNYQSRSGSISHCTLCSITSTTTRISNSGNLDWFI